jgi:phospholipase C
MIRCVQGHTGIELMFFLKRRFPKSLRASTAAAALLTSAFIPALAHTDGFRAEATETPIKHVIIVIGENHTFDNVFGTYVPKADQTIDNLLSKGIVNADGMPGPQFDKAKQRIGSDTDKYWAETFSTGAYTALPQPYRNFVFGVPDKRFPTNLPNGPFQISKYVPYRAYTGDPVHRFFQMWQDIDGGKRDKFVWVEETIGTGSNGNPPPPGDFNPKEGAATMQRPIHPRSTGSPCCSISIAASAIPLRAISAS